MELNIDPQTLALPSLAVAVVALVVWFASRRRPERRLAAGREDPVVDGLDTDKPQWLKGYAGQTTDELIALDGEYRTDSVVVAFEEAINKKAERLGGDRHLSESERVVVAIEALERAVNSDGYEGFFRNSAQHVPDIVSSLSAIHSEGVAELTRAAIAVLRLEGPLTPEAVESAMERDDDDRDERLDGIDQAYYETAGDLAGPLLEYIRANRDQIVLT